MYALRLSTFLISSDFQFGFKENYSCAHAIYTVVNYFSEQQLAAFDISKAFDKVNHFILFNKLLVRDIPADFIKVLVSWCGKCNVMVRWNGRTSRFFKIFSGVRQGGILSPLLFAVYVDVSVRKLKQSGYGCKIHGLFTGCILYADDNDIANSNFP